MNRFFLSLIACLLLTSQVWADADTLRPVGDRAKTDWTVYPSGDRWDAFDDTTTNEDVNYVYTKLNKAEGWYHTDWSDGTIDSVRLTARAKQSTAGTTENDLIVKRLYSSEALWYDCISNGDGSTDTSTLTTSYVDYPITWVNDPCTGTAWTQAGLNSASRAWAFKNQIAATNTLHVAITADAWMSHNTTASWSEAHDAGTCNSFNGTATDIRAGTWSTNPGDHWYFRRIPFIFNTASLPDACIIKDARLYIYLYGYIDDISPDEPTVHVVEGSFGGSLADDDFLYGTDFGTTSGGSKNFYGASLSTWHYIEFNATGIGWINPTGNTELGLMEYYDFADDSAGADGGNRSIKIQGNEGNMAYLKITYEYESRVTQSFITVFYTPTEEQVGRRRKTIKIFGE